MILSLFFFILFHSALASPSLPSCWVYHAKAPSQCVSNYMFLMEAMVSSVASPFASVARPGPGRHPRSPMPAPPMAQDYHYHSGLGSRRTAVTLGMTPTRLSGLGLWPAPPHPLTSESSGMCVPSKKCHGRQFYAGCVWVPWVTLSAVMDGPLQARNHGNRHW